MSPGNDIGPLEEPAAFWDEAEALGRAVRSQLEYFAALGVAEMPGSLIPLQPGGPAAKPSQAQERGGPRVGADVGPHIWAPECRSLADLAERTEKCRACLLAPEPPDKPLFGRGGARPLLVFVGPDPSIYEGEKAELLRGIIEKGLKLAEGEYYITTLTRCRLNDRDERAEEKAVAACGPILRRELALLKPKVVLALGSGPGRYLSGSADPVGLLRTKTHTLEGLDGIWLRVTFGLGHMASSVDIKKEGWKDMQKIIPGLEKLKKI